MGSHPLMGSHPRRAMLDLNWATALCATPKLPRCCHSMRLLR